MNSIGLFVSIPKNPEVLGPSVFRYLFAKVLASEAVPKDVEVFCFDIRDLSVDSKGDLLASSCWKWNGSRNRKQGRFVKTQCLSYPDIIIDFKLYLKKINSKKYPLLAKLFSLKGIISERRLGNAILTRFKEQGVRVVNDPLVSSKIRDKLLFYEVAMKRNFLCSRPKTFLVKDQKAVDALVADSDGLRGIVLKPVSSPEAAEVFWLGKTPLKEIKEQIAKRVSSSKNKFMIQEFIEPSAYLGAGPLRLRMFYCLGHVFEGYATIFTRPKTGRQFELKRNMEISSSVLTSNEINVLKAATSLIGSILSEKGDVFLISIDFLQSATGMYLLGANSQPAFDKQVQGKALLSMQKDLAARLFRQ